MNNWNSADLKNKYETSSVFLSTFLKIIDFFVNECKLAYVLLMMRMSIAAVAEGQVMELR